MVRQLMDHGKRYLYFLIALVISLFFTTLGRPWASVLAALLFLFAMVTAVYFITRSKVQRILLIGFAFLAVIPLWQFFMTNRKLYETINNAWWAVLTFYVGIMIFRNINRAQRISSNQIYAVVSVYLLIGVFFGLIYQTVLVFDPGALYFNPINFKTGAVSEGDIFYYSFITLSTVGYGDVSPVAPVVRSLSTVEAVVGIMYVATMIARFVASHSNRDS